MPQWKVIILCPLSDLGQFSDPEFIKRWSGHQKEDPATPWQIHAVMISASFSQSSHTYVYYYFPYNLITSQRPHLLTPSHWGLGMHSNFCHFPFSQKQQMLKISLLSFEVVCMKRDPHSTLNVHAFCSVYV